MLIFLTHFTLYTLPKFFFSILETIIQFVSSFFLIYDYLFTIFLLITMCALQIWIFFGFFGSENYIHKDWTKLEFKGYICIYIYSSTSAYVKTNCATLNQSPGRWLYSPIGPFLVLHIINLRISMAFFIKAFV